MPEPPIGVGDVPSRWDQSTIPEGYWEQVMGDVFEEEPAQIDAEFDQDCCEEVRQMVIEKIRLYLEHGAGQTDDIIELKNGQTIKAGEAIQVFENMDCAVLLDEIGETPQGAVGFATQFIHDDDLTFQEVYNECVNNKTPQGGDFTMGSPIDLAWRLLKHG